MRFARKLINRLQLRSILSYMLIYMMMSYGPGQAYATPTGAEVASGSASVTQSGNTTNVSIHSGRTIINWDSLDTSKNETLTFSRTGGGFTVLNRVVEGGATNFNGTLNGNQGHIIIVNPNGIVFGSTAVINAFKFTASALNISNADFLKGTYNFTGGDGTVINKGTITSEQVSLIGQSVLNNGTIRSTGGLVIMAAGDSVYLGEEGSQVVVDVSMSQAAGHTVTNNGTITTSDSIKCGGDTEGPAVILAAGDIFSTALEGIQSLRAMAVRDITIGDVSADTSVELMAGRNIEAGNINVGSPTQQDAVIWIKSFGGDVTTGYLNTTARSEASVTVMSAGDVTIEGDCSHGAVSAITNNMPGDDSASSKICIEGRNINIDYGIEAIAHGNLSSVADIHIHGGDNGTIDNPGDITINTHNGKILAWAETSGNNFYDQKCSDHDNIGTADATITIHTPGDITIKHNGCSQPVVAHAKVSGGGQADVSSNGQDGTTEETDNGSHAKIDIERNYDGDCQGCVTCTGTNTDTGTNTNTNTNTETNTNTNTLTNTETNTNTNTLTNTETNTNTNTNTNTETNTETNTNTNTLTNTETNTNTNTLTNTETNTNTNTNTNTETNTETNTNTNTLTNTETNTNTNTLTNTETNTNTNTNTETNTETNTNTNTLTNTETNTNTNTLTNTETNTNTNTNTLTNTETNTNTNTLTNTETNTNTNTNTNTLTDTETNTNTQTNTNTNTLTNTETNTNTNTLTNTETNTNTNTNTLTNTETNTNTNTLTNTETNTNTNTNTNTLTDTETNTNTQTNTNTNTLTNTETNTNTNTLTNTETNTNTNTNTLTNTETNTNTNTLTNTETNTNTNTLTNTETNTNTNTNTNTLTNTETNTNTNTLTNTETNTNTNTLTNTETNTNTNTLTNTETNTNTNTLTNTETNTNTNTLTNTETNTNTNTLTNTETNTNTNTLTNTETNTNTNTLTNTETNTNTNTNTETNTNTSTETQTQTQTQTNTNTNTNTSTETNTDTGIAPIQERQLKFTGCPALMNWTAKELGMSADQVQIYVEGSMALSSSVQPCDACAKLKNSALALADADGSQKQALSKVVNEFAPAGAPPSEEQMAMIAAAMKNPAEGSDYALAAQWLNALSDYVNTLHKDMQLPANESVAFAEKYTAPVTGGSDTALAAYVQARLAALGG